MSPTTAEEDSSLQVEAPLRPFEWHVYRRPGPKSMLMISPDVNFGSNADRSTVHLRDDFPRQVFTRNPFCFVTGADVAWIKMMEENVVTIAVDSKERLVTNAKELIVMFEFRL